MAADENPRPLFSEDFTHEFTGGGVTVLNPFQTPQHALLVAVFK